MLVLSCCYNKIPVTRASEKRSSHLIVPKVQGHDAGICATLVITHDTWYHKVGTHAEVNTGVFPSPLITTHYQKK